MRGRGGGGVETWHNGHSQSAGPPGFSSQVGATLHDPAPCTDRQYMHACIHCIICTTWKKKFVDKYVLAMYFVDP